MQVHTLLGLGSINSHIPFDKEGVIGDGAASPNDPVFLNHHTMVDCMLEEWIQRNKDDLDYPMTDRIRFGHRAEDYVVPLIPLFKQKDMLVTADNLGYSCNIPDSSVLIHACVTLIISALAIVTLSL